MIATLVTHQNNNVKKVEDPEGLEIPINIMPSFQVRMLKREYRRVEEVLADVGGALAALLFLSFLATPLVAMHFMCSFKGNVAQRSQYKMRLMEIKDFVR